MNNAQLNTVIDLNLHEGLFQSFHSTRNVTLDDEVEGLDLAIFESFSEVFERDTLTSLRKLSITLSCFTLFSNLAGCAVFFGNQECVTSARNARETLYLDWTRRCCGVDGLTVFINHGTYTAIGSTGNNGVTYTKSSRFNQDGCYSTASLIQTCFNGNTASILVGVCTQVQTSICSQQYGIKQISNTLTAHCRDVNEHHIATVFFGNQVVFGQLLTYLARVGFRLINLVDGNNNRHVGSLSMVQGLNGLRHDAIVSCNNQDCDVGYLSTTSTHRREGFVTWGVNEGDQAIGTFVVRVNLVGTNVLGNTTRFSGNDVCFADCIQQTCLTVVDVTHHGDHRRT